MEDYYKEWKLRNPNYYKEYYIKHTDKLDSYHYEWVKNNIESVKKYQKEYRKKYYIEKKLKQQNDKIEAFKATLPLVKLSLTNI